MDLSLILPVYNGERFLRESIESVLKQSADFEFIIVDDCSQDQSAAIIASYNDPRIRRYRNSTNQGLFKTLNRAISKSTGEWIRLWAQDDLMHIGCLEKEACFIQSHPGVGMFYTYYKDIDENGRRCQSPMYRGSQPEVLSPALASRLMFFHGSICGNIANVTLNRLALDECGLFREDMQIAGDFEMWVRLSERFEIGVVYDELVSIRRHVGQFSRQSGSYAIAIEEEKGSYEILWRRLPPTDIRTARRHERWRRNVT